jgi:hypothetical protein
VPISDARIGHADVVSQLPWPERFEVTLRFGDGSEHIQSVVTWHDAEKAVAIATRACHRRSEVVDAIALPLGAAPRAVDGTVDIAGDLHDRLDW